MLTTTYLLELIHDILMGTRNAPVHRAIKLLAEHGYLVPENQDTYYMMRQQRDDAISQIERLNFEIKNLVREIDILKSG